MNRNLTLDFFRGLLLLIMTYDHVGNFQISWYFGYFSAAEGFVFLSGLVAGIVFTKKQLQLGNTKFKSYLLKRTWKIYKYHILSLLFLLFFVMLDIDSIHNFWTGQEPFILQNPVTVLLLSLPFLYLPHQVDILPMYCLFILTSIIFFRLDTIKKKNIFMVISFLIWFVNVFGVSKFIESSLFDFLPVEFGKFEILGWQFIFFLGSYLGSIQHGKTPMKINKMTYFVIANMICIILFVIKMRFFIDIEVAGISLTDVDSLAPVRLANFLSVAYVLYFISVNYLPNFSVKWVAVLGQNSLLVFTFQTIMLIAILPFTYPLFEVLVIDKSDLPLTAFRFLILIVSCASLMIPVWINNYINQLKLKKANK